MLRKEQRQIFIDMGIEGEALEILLRETAAQRHKERVAAAKEMAIRHVESHFLFLGGDEIVLLAAAICYLDMAGVGGKDGVEGAGTLRHPAFNHAGSGRKHAIDGAAWSAAIQQAAQEMAPGLVFSVSIPEDDVPVLIVQDNGMTVNVCLEGQAPWEYTLVREALRVSLGISRWLQTYIPIDSGVDPRYWASLVNTLLGKTMDAPAVK